MYEGQTQDVILKRMLDKVTSVANKQEGTIIYDALSPASIETAIQYMELDSILLRVFAQTSYGTWLDLLGAEFGLTRKPATKATGTIKISGTNGTVISAGFIVQTATGLRFATTNTVTIASGSATANITASDYGSAYNIAAGLINLTATSLAGVTGVINMLASSGGAEIESDDDFRARIISKAQTPATSGNINHYKQWAMEIAGIGGVKVFPVWNGAGTVKVVLIDSNKQPANTTLVNTVSSHIEDVRPVGSTVTTVAATSLPINISVTVLKVTGYTTAQVQANITASIKAYLQSIAFNKDYISYANIGSVIFGTEGVSDYSNLLVNSGTNNVNINSDNVAVVGTITVS